MAARSVAQMVDLLARWMVAETVVETVVGMAAN